MVKFDTTEVQEILELGAEVTITVTGQVAGTPFEGSDTIRVIGDSHRKMFCTCPRRFTELSKLIMNPKGVLLHLSRATI